MFNGNKLKKLRKKKRCTQEQLASLIILNKTSISYFERNKRTPGLETLIDIAYALDTTPYYLLDAEETIKVNEDDDIYESFLSKDDIQIINEIKRHNEFYNKLCENPKEVIEKIIKYLY